MDAGSHLSRTIGGRSITARQGACGTLTVVEGGNGDNGNGDNGNGDNGNGDNGNGDDGNGDNGNGGGPLSDVPGWAIVLVLLLLTVGSAYAL